MNKEIRQFQDDLLNVINTANLPIEVKRLVLDNILRQVMIVADETIKNEMEVKEDGILENNLEE